MKYLQTTVVALFLTFGSMTGVYAQVNAAAVYQSKCQVCHGADGKGTPAGQKLLVKNFRSPEIAKMSDNELMQVIKNGKAKMPPYSGKLTDDQIKALVKYIRAL